MEKFKQTQALVPITPRFPPPTNKRGRKELSFESSSEIHSPL